jgi:hypothetical protein
MEVKQHLKAILHFNLGNNKNSKLEIFITYRVKNTTGSGGKKIKFVFHPRKKKIAFYAIYNLYKLKVSNGDGEKMKLA